ncbi:hypothetical protein Emed_005631 [Eimeria media]
MSRAGFGFMRGLPIPLPRGLGTEALPPEGAHSADKKEFVSLPLHLRTRCGFKLASALAALLAVAAVVFLVLQCDLKRLQRTRALGVGERSLASDDEGDDVESFVQESLMVCTGLAGADGQQVQEPQGSGDKQQAQEPQGAGAVPRRRRRRARATPANGGGTQPRTRKRPGKTGETMKILLKMAKSSAEFSESSHSSEGTSASPTSPSLAKDASESDEEPLKKKKTERLAETGSQVAKSKTTPGETSTSSGGPVGEEPFGIPSSLLELYFEDTLQAAADESIADWLLVPEADLPLSLTLSEDEEADVAAPQMGPETVASPESLGDSSWTAELAAILAGEQEQQDEVAGPSSVLMSSSDQPPEGAAFPLPEIAPTALEEPSTSAASTAATSPLLTKLLMPSGAALQVSSLTPTVGSPQASSPVNQHPFYRIPASWPKNVRLPFFSVEMCFRKVPEESLDSLLETVRRVLDQQSLSVKDIRTLQSTGEKMISYTGRYFTRQVSISDDSNLMRSLGIRVILAHYLLTVCNVVGPSMQKEQWWGPHMRRVLTPPAGWRPPSGRVTYSRGTDRAALVQGLIDAMRILGRGERLPAQLIVPIMQELLCSPDGLAYFKHPGWRGFREANERFLGIGPEESESSDDDDAE